MIKRIAMVVLILLILLTGTAYAMTDEDMEVMNYEEKHEITLDDALAVAAQLEHYDEATDVLAKVLIGEAGYDTIPTMEKAAVVWCVLNRVDAGMRGYDIISCATADSQFTGYSASNEVLPEYKELAKDVVTRWLLEKRNVKEVGRVLPEEYLWFAGHGGRNWFRYWYNSYSDNFDGSYWDWSAENPY